MAEPTLKQQQAVKAIVENGGNRSKALEKVGYSPNTAKTPQKVTDSKGFKEASKDFVKQMDKERQRVIKAMSERNLSKVDYDKLNRAVDTLTKNIQLLNGDETERVGLSLSKLFDNSDEYESS